MAVRYQRVSQPFQGGMWQEPILQRIALHGYDVPKKASTLLLPNRSLTGAL
jgi:hypothetical protein